MAPRAKRVKKTNMRQVAFTRFTLIVAFLVLWMGGIGARLVYLQVNQHDWLKQRALGQRQDFKRSKMPRGTIYDRNGRALAMSINVKTLYADVAEITDIKAAARSIAKALGAKESEISKQLADAKEVEKRFLPLAKGLDEEAAQKINNALEDASVKKADSPKFAGLHWRDDQKRSYPNQSLAAHIIGFSNADGVGQAGIEQSQNENLYGAVIKKIQQRDRLGRIYDETVSDKEPPKDVTLTISTSFQYKAEQALEKAVKNSGSKSGIAIVIDHKTGEILALANYPTFDPNKLNLITPNNLKNEAIQSIYSPGSAFKLITYGSALEKHLITPGGEIDPGNGTIEVGGHKFTDSHGAGKVTYSKALAVSSNVCAIKTGLRVGKDGFYEAVKKFGFGHTTGIELPAETRGIVRSPERWNGDSLASMSIGYEIGVSALQMASAFATIANNGVRIQPHIIKEIRQSDEQIVPVAQPEKEQVVSAETARDLGVMLRQVVLTGTGKMAQLNGYTSAGKTGTAWKFDEKLKRVNAAKYVSSFIGFAPAEDPAITIAVVMDEPKVGGRNGGQVAAPAFREIAEQILPELNVKPDLEGGPVAQTVDDVPETVGNGVGGLDEPIISDQPESKPEARSTSTTSLTEKEIIIKPVAEKNEIPDKAIKFKILEKDGNSKPELPPKLLETAKPKGQIKNKSSTEKNKEKT